MGIQTDEEPIPPRLGKVYNEDSFTKDRDSEPSMSLLDRLKEKTTNAKKAVAERKLGKKAPSRNTSPSPSHHSQHSHHTNKTILSSTKKDQVERIDFDVMEQPQRYYNRSLRQNGLQ
jgi:hypothetical protein